MQELFDVSSQRAVQGRSLFLELSWSYVCDSRDVSKAFGVFLGFITCFLLSESCLGFLELLFVEGFDVHADLLFHLLGDLR